TYVGDVTSGSEKQYFVDCNDAVCSTGSVVSLPDGSDADASVPRFRTAIQCLTSVNCKFAYYEGTASVNPTVQFADCDVTNCFPSVTGTVTYDNASSSNTNPDSSTLSWSHTTTTSANRILIVGVALRNNTAVSSITYNGTNLTKIRSDFETTFNDARSELWYMVNPDTGTNTVAITAASSTTIEGGAVTYSGVNTADPLINNNGANSAGTIGTTATVNLTSAPGETVVDSVSLQSANTSLTVGGGQTQRVNLVGTAGALGMSQEVGADTTTMSWTFTTSDYWTISTVGIRSLTYAPWSNETGVESVSLTYDSSNGDLYAHIIKDTSDKAYWKSTDAATISWSAATDYGWTTGTLNQISAPETSAGTTGIGVVLHEATNSNYEFAALPENLWFLIIGFPLGTIYYKKKRYQKLECN
ncbi:MAG: hypothetical protein AAB874_02500, partial [Patescibacteria group bacterium]